MKKIFILICVVFAHTFIFSQTQTERYSPELLWKLGRISEVQVSPDGKTILYGITQYNLQENKGLRNLYTLSVEGGTPVQITHLGKSVYNGIYRPDGKKIAYLAPAEGVMQIWEANVDGSEPLQISHTENDITGFSYAPNQQYILYTQRVKLDASIHDTYPDLPKANAYVADDMMFRHWDSWTDYSYSHIFVAPYSNGSMEDGKDIMLNQRFESPMAPFGGMEQITWSPDSQKIAYVTKKKIGKEYTLSTNSDIFLYDIHTGSEINLSEGNMGYDQDPVFSPDGKKLAWKSMERDGFESDKDRIFIYDFDQKKYQNYSENFDYPASGFSWSSDSKMLYFLSPYHGVVPVYSLNIASKEIKTVKDGRWDYLSVSPAGKYLITTKQSMLEPTEIYRIDAKGNEIQLTFTNEAVLKNVKSATVEERWIATTDGKKMLVWVILPPDFDASKKYPTLLYCQGGPQGMVGQFFSYRWNFQMMAANDYIVVAPNRRGLPGFGQEWNDQISGDYGGQNMKDYLSAIDEVAKEPYVDTEHLGAVGASYGGFSVYWLAGHHDKRFKAFIAHDGMFNLEAQYLETEEMWFVNWDLGGPYWDKTNAVAQNTYANSPHLFVDKWDTPILIFHGEQDFRIPYTEGLSAFNAAKLRGIPARYVHFPEENHWILRPQNGVLWQREFFRWLDEWLKP